MSKRTQQSIFGSKFWELNGKIHRTDGPAVEYTDDTVRWYLDGAKYEFEEWLDRTTGLTDEEKVMMKLQYG
jgi:beta-glucanase (GH16 family)